MTMKYRHTLDDEVGKVQDDVHGATIGNIHGIQPRRLRERDAVFCISQEVDLVCVEWMEFGSSIHDAPMLISANANARHWTCVRRKLVTIDVKTVLVLREGDREVRCSLLQQLDVDRLVKGRAAISSVQLLSRSIWTGPI